MAWNDITITAGVILALFGAITIIGNGISVISNWLKPMKKIEERVTANEQDIEKIKEDDEKINHILSAQSRLLIEMTTHMITGNDIEELKRKRDELTDAIIEDK